MSDELQVWQGEQLPSCDVGLDVFESLTKGADFLQRVQLYTKGRMLDKGIIGSGRYGVPQGEDEVFDLGDEVDVIPFSWRPKALDTSDRGAIIEVYDPADKELETKLYYPDRELYDRVVAEKTEVIRQVRASINDLKKAKRYLSKDQYNSLYQEFDFLLDAGLLAREWTRAFFAQRLYMVDPTEEHKQMVLDALDKLEKLDGKKGVPYGLDPSTGHRYNIDHFVLEMHWRIANRSRALAEDKAIIEWARNKADVRKN